MRKYDVILVLGVGLDKSRYKWRVDRAVDLYKNGIAPRILFSGRFFGGLFRKPESTEARVMARYARSKGVPAADILLEEKSLNTIGNFYFSKVELIVPHRWKRILVVTHRNHLIKAKFIAQKVFGHQYAVQFSRDNRKAKELFKEHGALMEFKKYYPQLLSIKDGDDKKIGALLKNLPFYKKYR